jgi:hypothetical protein
VFWIAGSRIVLWGEGRGEFAAQVSLQKLHHKAACAAQQRLPSLGLEAQTASSQAQPAMLTGLACLWQGQHFLLLASYSSFKVLLLTAPFSFFQ